MSVHVDPAAVKRAARDYATDQEVRWCPGCGDYAILKAVQRVLAEAGADPDRTAFVSGIGCSARFPYYMETYGFHTIHGRAPAIATGLALANPDIDLWIVSGDGDALSIGGNHLMHLLRRNLDCVFLLFNNEIYGLTKGQASPTSRPGTRSPTTPAGSNDPSASPARFALGSGARFVARTIDVAQAHSVEVLKRAHGFGGTGFVEILQNCPVFNDGVFEAVTNKKTAPDARIELVHGQPMVFGAGRTKGLRLDMRSLRLEVVDIGDGPGAVAQADLLVHDETNRTLAHLLADLDPTEGFPTPIGVIYADPATSFTDRRPRPEEGPQVLDRLAALVRGGASWEA